MTTLNPSEATSLALNTLTSQIRNILLMPDGPAKAAIGSFETLLNANLTMISEAANAHINEFNTLVGELEARDSELLTQAILVSQLRQQVAEAEQQLADAKEAAGAKQDAAEAALYAATRKADGTQAHLNAANIQIRELERQLKALRALDPEGLKRKVAEQRKKLDERLTAINAHKNENSGYRRDNIRLSRNVTELTAIIDQQQAEQAQRQQVIDDMARFKEVSLLWGKHLRKHYTDEQGIRWNVYLVDHGLKSNLPYLINDLNWKLHAMKSDGSGCSVMLSQWMNPIYPTPYGAGAPDDMTRDIFAFMQEALEQSHPHLQPRTEWAKTVSIHECGLPPRTIKPLIDAGIDTLYKVMSHQGNKLDKVKGIGAKLVGQIVYACELKVKMWEEQFAANQQAEQHKEAA